jgi:hypothetical protein
LAYLDSEDWQEPEPEQKTDEQISAEMFAEIDDGDAEISAEELQRVRFYALSHFSLAFLTLDTFLTLRFSLSQGLSARGLRISEKDLGQAFAATDQDGGGTLVFAEWQSSGLATAVDAIAEYATPGAGVLTIDQARRKLTDIGVPPSKINRAVRVMDADRTFSGEHICHPNPSLPPCICVFYGIYVIQTLQFAL